MDITASGGAITSVHSRLFPPPQSSPSTIAGQVASTQLQTDGYQRGMKPLLAWFEDIFESWPLSLKVNSTPGNRLYDPHTPFYTRTNCLFWLARVSLAESRGAVVIPRGHTQDMRMIQSMISVYYGVTLIDLDRAPHHDLAQSTLSAPSTSSRDTSSSEGSGVAPVSGNAPKSPTLTLSIPAAFWSTGPSIVDHLLLTGPEEEVAQDLVGWFHDHQDYGFHSLTVEQIWENTRQAMDSVGWTPVGPGEVDALGRRGPVKLDPEGSSAQNLDDRVASSQSHSSRWDDIASTIRCIPVERTASYGETGQDCSGATATTISAVGLSLEPGDGSTSSEDLLSTASPDIGRDRDAGALVDRPSYLEDFSRTETTGSLLEHQDSVLDLYEPPDFDHDFEIRLASLSEEPPMSTGVLADNTESHSTFHANDQMSIHAEDDIMIAAHGDPLAPSHALVPSTPTHPTSCQAAQNQPADGRTPHENPRITHTGPARCGQCTNQNRPACVVLGRDRGKCQSCAQSKLGCDLMDPYVQAVGRVEVVGLCEALDRIIEATETDEDYVSVRTGTRGTIRTIGDPGAGLETRLRAQGFDSAKVDAVMSHLVEARKHMVLAGQMARVYGVSQRVLQDGLTEQARNRVSFVAGEWAD